MKKHLLATCVALCTNSLLTIVFAIPAHPSWHQMEQPDGTTIEVRQVGDEFFHYWINRDGQHVTRNEAGYWDMSAASEPSEEVQLRRKAVNAARQMRAVTARKNGGKTNMTKGIIILVNYRDVSFQTTNTKAAFTSMMMDDSYSYNKTYPGSAHKYFYDQSNGQYNPQFDVFGPYTLSQNRAYYGGNDRGNNDTCPAQMVKEACSLADADVDFSKYDLDKNGEVDFVYVFYAGQGEADSDEKDAVWPHAWDLSSAGLSLKCDGKNINLYACSSELDGKNNRAGIATFCHEFSHVIGMPDYYDINYGSNNSDNMTPGEWSLMDMGSYNGNGYCPPNYSIYDKYYMGWATPAILNSARNVTMTTGYADAYQINASGSLAAYNNTSTQYYLENRQQSGWDKALPGHGMLAWKVTFSQTVWNNNSPNATAGTIRYGLLSATGSTKNIGTDADSYPGTKNVTKINSYAPFTTYPITDIKESSNTITFKFMATKDSCTYGVLSDPDVCKISSDEGTVKINSALNLTITAPGYYLGSADCWDVEMGNNTLTYGSGFTYDTNTGKFSIAKVTGDVGIYIYPHYIVTWTADGVSTPSYFATGANLVLPTDPADCSSGKKFVGWTEDGSFEGGDTAPEDFFTQAGSKTVSANTTYYAVYATETDTSSAPIRKAGTTTATMTTFTAISGNVGGDTNIEYKATQGKAGTAPVVNNNEVRIYQNGGLLTVTAQNKTTITDITVGSSMATTLAVQIDGGSWSTGNKVSEKGTLTKSKISASEIAFRCDGSDKKSRFYLNRLSVTYSGGGGKSYTDYSLTCNNIGTKLEIPTDKPRATKRIENGQLIIEYNGIRYTITGAN